MTRLNVALSGDCMVTRGSLITADSAARRLRELLHGADFAFTNLEVVPTDGHGYPVRDPASGGCLVAADSVLDEVTAAGFSVLGCANNHALDMGVEGLLATMRMLGERRIPFAGIGAELTAARMPAYADRPAGSLALISCTSTFLAGQEAAAPSPQMPGRPGVSPLGHSRILHVTAEQMSVLRAIDEETGLRAQRAGIAGLLGTDPAGASADGLSFLGGRFRIAQAPGLSTACVGADAYDIARWVRDARYRADVVMVSIHTHEHGETPDAPADFIRQFAHRVIDEGADLVAGHGPHFLRGVELYRGKPIFYSLGNVVSQIELTDRIPAEDYAQVTGGKRLTPALYFALRMGQGRRWFGAQPKYWQTVVPVLTFDGSELKEIRVHPVDLGHELPVHHRGRPMLAGPQQAAAILADFAALSAAFGTPVAIEHAGTGPIGRVACGSSC